MNEEKAFTHRIPTDLLEQIDRVRGDIPRNTWMNMILAREVAPDKIIFGANWISIRFSKDELADLVKSAFRADAYQHTIKEN